MKYPKYESPALIAWKVLYANQRACHWLAEANRLLESGKSHTKAYQQSEEKAQRWLDKLNSYEGIAE